MSSLYPNSTQNKNVDHQVGHQRYQRAYQPYVFQPNFLKQQIRQRDLEKAARLSNNLNEDGSLQTVFGNQAALDESQKKKSGRKVIDWTSSCVLYLQKRRFNRSCVDTHHLIPDPSYSLEMQSTMGYKHCPVSSVATKFVRSATNKMKCPVYKVVWTPDGRRLVTGSASGEFTLWNGTVFNFETILQAHDSPVRAMSWSRNDAWLITGDNHGYIKYWQLNMNNVKMYQAHKDQACRSVCFGPTDNKFATASDDGTVRIWDFHSCVEENILRGHGADVKQVDWHPYKSLVASASKDLQTPVKLWDPKSGQSLCTIHAHKGTVMDVKWNRNGNCFLTASRDHLIKLYDIRNLKKERQVFRGHRKEAFTVAWHPIHEDLFASGGSEGSIIFWQLGEDKDVGSLEGAHESLIWSLAWHPLGHILVSGSNDHSTKFWTRNRPGDAPRERNNPTTLFEDAPMMTSEDTTEDSFLIPGMGDADEAAADVARREEQRVDQAGIPGLEWTYSDKSELENKILMQQQENSKKKIPFARPVPRAFVNAWESKNDTRRKRRSVSPPSQRTPEAEDRREAPVFDVDLRRRNSDFEMQRFEGHLRDLPPPPCGREFSPQDGALHHNKPPMMMNESNRGEMSHDFRRGPPPPFNPERFHERPRLDWPHSPGPQMPPHHFEHPPFDHFAPFEGPHLGPPDVPEQFNESPNFHRDVGHQEQPWHFQRPPPPFPNHPHLDTRPLRHPNEMRRLRAPMRGRGMPRFMGERMHIRPRPPLRPNW